MLISAKQVYKVCLVMTGLGVFSYLLFFYVAPEKSAITDVRGWDLISLLLQESHSVSMPESPQKNDSSKWLRSLPVNRQRLYHLQKMCSHHGSDHYLVDRNRKESMFFFLVDTHHKLLNCYIPKVGSSTMKRIFSILKHRNRGQSLFNISSRFIHRRPGSYTGMKKKLQAGGFLRAYHLVNTFTKILFVRDPYERLFSAFIDRLFGISENLALRVRVMMPNDSKTNPCAIVNLTFRHVIDYVTQRPVVNLDAHFSPYYTTCFPCHLSYDYVGKMETFCSDVKNVLTSLGVDSQQVLGDDKQFDATNELSILRDVSLRAFELMNRQIYLRCFTKFGILKRTWVTFQVRGYLSINDSFPFSPKQAETVSPAQFLQTVHEAYLGVKDRSAVRQKRGMALKEAYYTLARPLLYKLQTVLQRDCDLFGYDCSVDRRFKESEQSPAAVFHFN